MHIAYIANVRMPTEKAHGAQIVKTCEALARAGVEVELVVPRRRNSIAESPFSYYGIEENFKISYVPVFDTVSWGLLGFLLETFFFARKALPLARSPNTSLIFGRDELVLVLLIFFGAKNVMWESHTGAWNAAARYVARRARSIVVISQGLKRFYVERGVAPEQILVAHDGISLADFAHPERKEEARLRLGLPLDKKIALYIGRLDGWKGVEILCEAAAYLPSDYAVALIGGEPTQVKEYKKKYPKVIFLGYRKYKELPDNQAAADVLVLPNTGKDIISAQFTSPLKLFSYMAAHIPIIASDLPSIREVLDDTCAYLVPPDDPRALAGAITKVCANKASAQAKAEAAYGRVSQFDWKKRAQIILAFTLGEKA